MPRGGHPSAFDPRVDLLALHYDCSPDPDDMQSLAADRTLLEHTFGLAWVRLHVVPVIGTFGKNDAYKSASCERVAQAAWGDVTGFLRASEPTTALPADGRVWKWQWHGSTPASSVGGWQRAPGSVGKAMSRWHTTLEAGGQVFVKEGGQSDFTTEVVGRLEARWPGIGRCVHVVQHAKWNEEQNGEGVTSLVENFTDYLAPVGVARGTGVVTDGNKPLAAFNKLQNALFVAAANASGWACAWRVAFEEFGKHEHVRDASGRTRARSLCPPRLVL